MKNSLYYLMILLGFLFLLGCTSIETTQEQSTTFIDSSPAEEELSYPVTRPTEVEDMGYPISEETFPFPKGPEFTIDVPVKGGAVIVTGKGPANVPIRLVNVSEVGLILGETTIQNDGSFLFTIEEPLISDHMIGLQLGDIRNTGFTEEGFLYSETYYERPFVGILFDLVVVE